MLDKFLFTFDFIFVRFHALFNHKLKGHTLGWRVGADEVCAGDIVCETCNLVIWCRWLDPKWMGGRRDV
jgi:hypothetical protein